MDTMKPSQQAQAIASERAKKERAVNQHWDSTATRIQIPDLLDWLDKYVPRLEARVEELEKLVTKPPDAHIPTAVEPPAGSPLTFDEWNSIDMIVRYAEKTSVREKALTALKRIRPENEPAPKKILGMGIAEAESWLLANYEGPWGIASVDGVDKVLPAVVMIHLHVKNGTVVRTEFDGFQYSM